MQRLVINKFTGGISNDPSIGGAGSVFDAQGVDIHNNAKEVKLAKSYSNALEINTRVQGRIVGSIYEGSTKYIELSKDGYLSRYLNNDLNNGVITNSLGTSYNIGTVTSVVDKYGFIISSGNLYQWVFDETEGNLGTYDTGTGIQTDPEFDLGTGWTVGANWSIASGKATHTTGSTAVLSRSMSDTVSQQYRIATSASVTAGTCAVKVAGTTIYTLSTSTNSVVQVDVYTAASDPELLEFVPSTDFDGYIEYCRIQEYNLSSYAKSFNESSPYITLNNFIYIGNGSVITEIDTTLATWVITDVLSIDKDYTIKGMTKIGDQVFIYATDGAGTRQYLWDGVNTTTSRVINWIDKPVLNVANFANIDYILTGGANRQTLSRVNGYQLEPVIQTPDYISSEDRIFLSSDYTNAIETVGNKLLIPGDAGVYSFGKRTPGLPNALIKEFLIPGGRVTSMFYTEKDSSSLIVYAYGIIDGTLGNYRFSFEFKEGSSVRYGELKNQSTGWIEIHNILGQTYSNVKNFEKISNGVELETDTQLNVYRKIEENYTNIYLSGTGYTFAVGDTYTKGGITYTIYEVTERDSKNGYILHCTYSGAYQTGKEVGTFTRTSGSGPATFYSNLSRFGYKLLKQVTDAEDSTVNDPFAFNKGGFVTELISFNGDYTPRLFDINLYYGEEDDN